MALTREFKDTVLELCKDPEYRKGLLLEALESYLEGDVVVGNSLLRDYLNGTQAFEEVARDLQMQEAGLRRMVSPKGNATAKNLFRLFKLCQDREGIHSADELLGRAA
jgi:DNA-binding phage protein